MNHAIILAGGSGKRAGGILPKQFQMLGDAPIVWHSIRCFHRYDPHCRIIVPIHKDYREFWDAEIKPFSFKEGIEVTLTDGGITRIESVKKGLQKIIKQSILENYRLSSEDLVFIHDGARPFITEKIISEGAGEVACGNGAIPVVPVTDSLRRKTEFGTCPVEREKYMAVQTPQIFIFNDINRAYDQIDNERGLTDDASVAESAGIRIVTYMGDPSNIKITNPIDFQIAKALLSEK